MKKTSKRTAASPKPSRVRPRSRPPGKPPGKPPRRPSQRPAVKDVLVAFADVAKRLGLRWYVFGAQAVNLYGFPRATADLDLTVDLEGISAQMLLDKLVSAGFVARFADAAFIAATRVIPIVHRASKLPVDVVLAGPGLEERFLDEVTLHAIGRRKIPVISVENLIVTKVLAGRPKDLEDIRELCATRGDSLDVVHVVELLALLENALDEHDLLDRFAKLRA